MKKILSCIFIILSVNFAKSQNINITDSLFKKSLFAAGVDLNNDKEIQLTEALAVDSLTIPGGYYYIKSIKGINHFKNLKILNLYAHRYLDSLNLNKLTKLTKIRINDCESLISIKTDSLINLEKILVSGDTQKIENLTIKESPVLKKLTFVKSTELSNIDLSENENLIVLAIRGSNISNLDLSKNVNLESLTLNNSKVSNLNLENNKLLTFLDISYNPIENLNFLTQDLLKKLTHLDVSGLGISNLSFINQNLGLISLSCNNNKLATTNFLNFLTDLKNFSCSGNQISNINLQIIPNLEKLSCGANQLTDINLLGVPKLKVIYCDKNQLTNIDFTYTPDIEFINVSQNNISNLDLTSLSKLIAIDADNNNLQELDFSGNSLLWRFSALYNDLIYVNCKNGSANLESFFGRSVPTGIYFNPNLKYICADENEVDMIKETLQYRKRDQHLAPDIQVNSYCTLRPGGEYFELEGYTVLNYNGNCNDSNLQLPNFKLKVTYENGENEVLTTNEEGKYRFFSKEGNYVIKPIINTDLYDVDPAIFEFNLSSVNNSINQNFCINPKKDESDIEVSIVPVRPAIPGFYCEYKISLVNNGTIPSKGEVSFRFNDDIMNFESLLPTNNPFKGTGIIKWNYENILPFESKEFYVNFKLNTPTDIPAVNAGDILSFEVESTSEVIDYTLDNNVFTLNQEVVNSFDPNDKTCLNGKFIKLETEGSYVYYLIRFENLGTANAKNVIVTDVIDSEKFDVSSFTPIDSSHDFVTSIKGNKIEFVFENIDLSFEDDKNDGYIMFKIKTLKNLPVDSELKNEAYIYFDYNKPIKTNEYITTIKENIPFNRFSSDKSIKVYPNPFNKVFFVESNFEIKEVYVYNLLGGLIAKAKRVDEKQKNLFTVDGLKKETYYILNIISAKNNSYSTKVLKM